MRLAMGSNSSPAFVSVTPEDPVEQLRPKIGLKRGDLTAQGRLGEIQLLGRACEMPNSGYRLKGAQLV
jgi:hypothetical protein